MKKHYLIVLLSGILTLAGCGGHNQQDTQLMSVQIIDRNGFKESVSSPDRLKVYQKVNFFAPQPYHKVVRFFSRTPEGKTPSRMTAYHDNGEVWQYLEVVNGRACGVYREWHPNGRLHLDVTVIEGVGDLSESAQESWIFDGTSRVWDDQGRLTAEFNYEKGCKQGPAFYYHANGKLKELIPYENDIVNGDLLVYDDAGHIIGKTTYIQGKRDGLSTFKGNAQKPPYSEEYQNDLLMSATYHDFSGRIISRIHDGNGKRAIFSAGRLYALEQFCNGIPEGEVELFNEQGQLFSSFFMKDETKHGEEYVYYPSKGSKEPQPKLTINWVRGQIHGITRTWYPDGTLESEREMHENQKHGISSAWYRDGSLMLIEEYDHDQLIMGSYMRRGGGDPISAVEDGKGTATLYDSDGYFLKKIAYEKGQPVVDEP